MLFRPLLMLAPTLVALVSVSPTPFSQRGLVVTNVQQLLYNASRVSIAKDSEDSQALLTDEGFVKVLIDDGATHQWKTRWDFKEVNDVSSVQMSGDGSKLAASRGDTVYLLDVSIDLASPVLVGEYDAVNGLFELSRDGRTMAVARASTVNVYRLGDGDRWLDYGALNAAETRTISISADGNRVAVAKAEGIIQVFRIEGAWTSIGQKLIGGHAALSANGAAILVADKNQVTTYRLVGKVWRKFGESLNASYGLIDDTGNRIMVSIFGEEPVSQLYDFIEGDWQLGELDFTGVISLDMSATGSRVVVSDQATGQLLVKDIETPDYTPAPTFQLEPTMAPTEVTTTGEEGTEIDVCQCDDDFECLETPIPIGLRANVIQFCMKASDPRHFQFTNINQFKWLTLFHGPTFREDLVSDGSPNDSISTFHQVVLGGQVVRSRIALSPLYWDRFQRGFRALLIRNLVITAGVKNQLEPERVTGIIFNVTSQRLRLVFFLEGDGWFSANSATVWITRLVVIGFTVLLTGCIRCCCCSGHRSRQSSTDALQRDEATRDQVVGVAFGVHQQRPQLDLIVEAVMREVIRRGQESPAKISDVAQGVLDGDVEIAQPPTAAAAVLESDLEAVTIPHDGSYQAKESDTDQQEISCP